VTPKGNPVPDTLFVFIDESRNFDFSTKGTRHFVMARVAALATLLIDGPLERKIGKISDRRALVRSVIKRAAEGFSYVE
jgi:hypothetical protein